MIGGNSNRALIDLTGLVYISFNPGLYNSLPERYQIEDKLQSTNQLIGCCAIRFKKENANSEEDYDGHAYSILCINKIEIDSRIERVYTLRNPHGEAKEGSRWSSNNAIWEKVDQESKIKVMYEERDILTWMNSQNIKSNHSCFKQRIRFCK